MDGEVDEELLEVLSVEELDRELLRDDEEEDDDLYDFFFCRFLVFFLAILGGKAGPNTAAVYCFNPALPSQ